MLLPSLISSGSQQHGRLPMCRPFWVITLTIIALVNYLLIQNVGPWLPSGWEWLPYAGLAIAVLGLYWELFCPPTDPAQSL
jgi:hypothetical protein